MTLHTIQPCWTVRWSYPSSRGEFWVQVQAQDLVDVHVFDEPRDKWLNEEEDAPEAVASSRRRKLHRVIVQVDPSMHPTFYVVVANRGDQAVAVDVQVRTPPKGVSWGVTEG